jgi:hypothetical protein
MNMKEIKKKAYNMAGKIESQVERKEGIPGGIADIVRGAGKIIKTVAEGAKSVHEDIKNKGGYGKVAGDALEKVADKIDPLLEKIDKSYQSFEDSFFIDGLFDEEKAKQALSNTAEATKKYGSIAVQNLSKLVKEGVKTAKADYRTFIPSKGEREGKYKGIGTAYAGKILFRDDFESCIGFYIEANKKLPQALQTKKAILNDIKTSASKNAEDLTKFYSSASDKNAHIKEKVIQRYLKF